MAVLEVFFDYACPYCKRGHALLMELLPEYPEISVLWRPCEAHPRPERYGQHTDLCIQALFFAQEQEVDIAKCHERLYDAALGSRVNVESVDALCAYMAQLLDEKALQAALRGKVYEERQQDLNRYAYDECGVWVVPAYRLDGRRLDAIEDVGVTRAQLRAFLSGKR